MIRRVFHAIALALTLVVLAAPRPSHADNAALDFTLHNNSGVAIHQLFISPSSKDEWQEDTLGEDVLESGASVNIAFSPNEEAEQWDIKVVASDGSSLEFHGVNLTHVNNVYLDDNQGAAHSD